MLVLKITGSIDAFTPGHTGNQAKCYAEQSVGAITAIMAYILIRLQKVVLVLGAHSLGEVPIISKSRNVRGNRYNRWNNSQSMWKQNWTKCEQFPYWTENSDSTGTSWTTTLMQNASRAYLEGLNAARTKGNGIGNWFKGQQKFDIFGQVNDSPIYYLNPSI